MSQKPHSKEVLVAIKLMSIQGMSGRKIARTLNISKSSVNDYLRKPSATTAPEATKRFMFLDIETACDISLSFKRFKANMSQAHILQDGGWLLSIAWQFMDEESPQGLALTPDEALRADDSRLVSVLYALFEKADVIAAHFGDRFDLPQVKARFVINNFHPPKKVRTIDTYKMAKQMKFQSSSLQSLGHVLGLGSKVPHVGIQMWRDCMSGDQAALDKMLEYNIGDIELLKAVYHRLAPHSTRQVNAGLFTDSPACPVCGSHNLSDTGNVIHTVHQTYNEIECLDCHARSRGTKSIGKKLTVVN